MEKALAVCAVLSEVKAGYPIRRFPILLAPAFTLISLVFIGSSDAFDTPVRDLSASAADLTTIGGSPGDEIGWQVAAGDLDDDGIQDMLLGAYFADVQTGIDAGASYIVFGAANLSGTRDPCQGGSCPGGSQGSPPEIAIIGAEASDELGTSVATGDFNGDGADDVLIGADDAGGPSNARHDAGEAYVILGPFTRPAAGETTTIDIASTPPALTIYGADEHDELGWSVAAGDFNEDGEDDVLVGAVGADGLDNAKPSAGEAYVVYGSITMSNSVPTKRDVCQGISCAGLTQGLPPDVTVFGADAGDELTGAPVLYGFSLAAGNVTGSVADDLLLGAPSADGIGNTKQSAGEANVIAGSSSLPSSIDLATAPVSLKVVGGRVQELLGISLAAGDVSRDGKEDLILGAPGGTMLSDNTKRFAGRVYVLYGGNMSGTIDLAINQSAPPVDITVSGVKGSSSQFPVQDLVFGDWLGQAVSAGDFNNDGWDDLLLGGFKADPPGRTDAGEAYAVMSSPAISKAINLATTAPHLTVRGAESVDQLSWALGTGDFKADGADELLMGARFANPVGRTDAGASYMISGDLDEDNDSVVDSIDNCPLIANTDQANTDGDQRGNACDNCAATTTVWYTPSGDSDCDGFSTVVEAYLTRPEDTDGTDPNDACANTTGANNDADDAWPPDVNDDRIINVFDAALFNPLIGTKVGDAGYKHRFDLNADGLISYRDRDFVLALINRTCTN